MRVLSWLIGLPVAAVAVVFAVVNRRPVDVELWPLPWTVALPLFVLVLGALAVGLVTGGVIVWISGARARRRARAEARRAALLEHRVKELEGEKAYQEKEKDVKALPSR